MDTERKIFVQMTDAEYKLFNNLISCLNPDKNYDKQSLLNSIFTILEAAANKLDIKPLKIDGIHYGDVRYLKTISDTEQNREIKIISSASNFDL